MNKYISKELIKSAFVCLILDILLFAVFISVGKFNSSVAKGALIGTLAAIFFFAFLGIIIEIALGQNSKRARFVFTVGWILRYIVLFVYLYLVLTAKDINPVCAVVPLFAPKINFYISAFAKRKNKH